MTGKIAYRVGVDIGGTFTDIVLLGDDGTVHTEKISSSVDNYARAIVEGLGHVLRDAGIVPEALSEIRHGTTVASNAILEHKGAKVGLITTKGFRDVLEIRTLRMPRLYDIAWEKPPPLVERYLRRVVDERVDAKGHVERALDTADAEAQVDALLAEKVEAVAVCLINSFDNPAHELEIKEIVRRKAPGLPVCISYEVLPEIKEYERTSTTVINAYVIGIVGTYLAALRKSLDEARIRAPLLLMQSNGGLTTDKAAAERPIHIIESGPAGGVVGAQALARTIELGKIITFDMGGTTAKASMVEDGKVMRAQEYAVGAGIMVGSRLLTGSGYLLRVPAIDLAEVGAGGGSIVWRDAGGALQVGPRSAGAFPGPLCYDLGGTEPTVTDANVVLGYLNPTALAGGAVKLNAARSHEIFQEKVAAPLGLPLAEAAYGAHLIAASNMMRAIRAVSSERGRDPREYALFAFGGNGPLFAAGMARALEMTRVIVPPAPGLFSAFGLLYSEVEHHYVRTWRRPARGLDPAELNEAFGRLEDEARAQLAAEGFSGAAVRIAHSADCRYQGQSFELTVPVTASVTIEEAFAGEHERTYGHRAGADEPVEIVSLRVVGQGLSDRPRVPKRVQIGRGAGTLGGSRRVYFGQRDGWLVTPVLSRSDLATPREGPAIVEEYDATCVVPPGARAALDGSGNIVMEV